MKTKSVVFLGSPACASVSLERLLAHSRAGKNTRLAFSVVATVTQPPKRSGRGRRRLIQTPVHEAALEANIPNILTPENARQPEFIEAVRDLAPDLLVTAAYGSILPKKLLEIPRFGTLNVHPSLLPRWRGAAPVQRALCAGDDVVGVSVLRTVFKMDAGPLLHRSEVDLRGDEHAGEVLEKLFTCGTEALVSLLPAVWEGTAEETPQDDAKATHAPMLRREEGHLRFGGASASALALHNQVRGLSGWPGTFADFVCPPDNGAILRLKIITTRMVADGSGGGGSSEVRLCGDAMRVNCGGGGVLEIVKVQPPGKRVMDARAFWNGLRGKPLHWVE